MAINVLEKGNEQTTVETLGGLLCHTYFIHMFMITLTATFLLLFLSIGNYWPSICHEPDAALFGLIGGLYTLSITGLALIISTILVDDCSWFFKFFTLLCSSLLFIGCGTYHLYGYYQETKCQTSKPETVLLTATREDKLTENQTRIRQAPLATEEENEHSDSCFKDVTLQKYNFRTPLLILACIFVGVVYFLFSLYLSLTLDTE